MKANTRKNIVKLDNREPSAKYLGFNVDVNSELAWFEANGLVLEV